MIPQFDEIYKYMLSTDYDWGHEHITELLNKRKNGGTFTMRDHLESLVTSFLCANRPNGPIYDNAERLREIFHNYDPDYLYSADPEELASSVCAISCGNKRIRQQMIDLRYNIDVLRRITVTYWSPDALLQFWPMSKRRVYNVLTNKYGAFKIKGLGDALFWQYIKQLGVDCVKPDVHLLRILSRLGLLEPYSDGFELNEKCSEISDEYPELSVTDVGEILWHFCAVDYLNICGSTPRCNSCPVNSCPYRR